MSAEGRLQTELAIAALTLFPRTVRVSILENAEFRAKFELDLDATLSFESGIQIKRSVLFPCVRQLLAGASAIEVRSKDGQTWQLAREGQSSFFLVRESQRIVLPDFRCFDSHLETRLQWFSEQLAMFHLSESRLDKWRTLLRERPLDDEELEPLFAEFRLSPTYVASATRDRLRREFVAADLIPTDLRYYERLVGTSEEGFDAREYLSNSVPLFIVARIVKDKVDGAKAAFALCVHQTVSGLIDLSALSVAEIVNVFEWITDHGDSFSQLGAIEFGLKNSQRYPELQPHLSRLVSRISEAKPDDPNSRLHLMSALIMLVDGCLAHSGHFRLQAPYWRRYAAFVHAGILEREIRAMGFPGSEVAEWAIENGATHYYFNSLIDLRREPRWFPDFVAARNLKGEFVGRIAIASEGQDSFIQDSQLRELLWGEHPGSIKSQRSFPLSYLPGPLEGGLTPTIEIPEQLDKHIRTQLAAEDVSVESFIGLVNSSLTFRVTPELADLAAETLRRVRYQLRSQRGSDHAFLLLNGLAMAAAVTRSMQLADDVRTLARVVRHQTPGNPSPAAVARIALVAAAANQELEQWARFVGEWLTELAFVEMSNAEAKELLTIVARVCELEPLLWETCSRAHSALTAFLASFPEPNPHTVANS